MDVILFIYGFIYVYVCLSGENWFIVDYIEVVKMWKGNKNYCLSYNFN